METPPRPQWTWPSLFDCPTCPARRGQRCQTKSQSTGRWTGYTNRGFHPARKAIVADMTAARAAAGFAALDVERQDEFAARRAQPRTITPQIAATHAAVNAAMTRVNREVLADERGTRWPASTQDPTRRDR